MEFLERLLILIVGSVLWISGIMLIVFGSIALADPEDIINTLNLIHGVSYVTSIFNVAPLFEGVSIFMVVLGCFLFFAGLIGFGVLVRRKIRLGYVVSMGCAILTEIALIIYASVYPGTVIDWVDEQMMSSLNEFQSVKISTSGSITYSGSGSVAYGWQNLQFLTQCCGVNDRSDFNQPQLSWERSYTIDETQYNVTYPPSCCLYYGSSSPLDVDYLVNYKDCFSKSIDMSLKPCSDIVISMIWQFNYISIIICSCLIATEIIGIMMTMFYVKRDDD